MKFSLILAALAAPLLAAAASVTPRAPLSLNPTNITPRPIVDDGIAPPPTNAERLRRGLPLKAPRRRYLPTRVAGARRADPSPTTYSGKLRVTTNSGTVLGFLTGTLNDFGEYGAFAADAAGGQTFSVTVPAAGGPLDVSTPNGPVASLPYFGGVVGFSSASNDLAGDSANYAVIVASGQTPAGAPATSVPNSYSTATGLDGAGESAVWSYNVATGALTPQWVNTDSSRPTTYIVYSAADNGILAFTGSPDEFRNNYGPADVVTFTLVI